MMTIAIKYSLISRTSSKIEMKKQSYWYYCFTYQSKGENHAWNLKKTKQITPWQRYILKIEDERIGYVWNSQRSKFW